VDVRLGYRVLLRAHGYDTFFAVDGMSAISEARKHQPDLIILDLGLPACYGFMVLERFSANTCLARSQSLWCPAATCTEFSETGNAL
jgi:DNA-binding response OmpR family regulator